MDLQTLRFFKEIADTGSFTAASENLHYAQSNLSTQIMHLEEELGSKLFYRNKRGVTLTSKGITFYEYASRILQLTEESVSVMHDTDHPRGSLTIGSIEAPALSDLPRLLGRYHMKYPEVKLSLQTDMNDVFPPLVLNHKLDGAFIVGPAAHPLLNDILLKKDNLILVGNSFGDSEDSERILRDRNLITFTEGSAFRKRMELLLMSKSILYTNRLTVFNSLGAMISNIIAGLGYGYLPRSIAQNYINLNLMKEYPMDDPYSEIDVVFIYHKEHIMDAAFRLFLETLEAGL